MIHLPPFISDLALILIAAGIVTLIFRRLRQPVVLGYIIAGLLIGPHFPWAPTITDTENVKVWAEIGVIFLLFALGLEFSFKKLARVGMPASITAIVEVVAMVAIGFLAGRMFGWRNMDSLFMGGILAISSTTIIIRAFDELGMKTRGFVSLVFGVLIVEDLVAIILLVLLSTVAISQTVSGGEMLMSTVKLGFFLTLWFLGGIFLIPSFLKRAKPLMRDETLLVVSLGFCFLMVVLATKAGFSPALGAFIMGSILAETTDAEKIEHLVHPVKDLFAAVFFVSVGMLIDPQVLREYAAPVIILTVVTIFGKALSTSIGALISGQSLRHSVQSGMSLAQIGEFSFIIASLGLSLKVTSDFLYPVAIGVSAVTTFTTPYMIRSADTVVGFLEKRLPEKWLLALHRYSESTRSVSQRSEWRELLRALLVKAAVNVTLVIAIFLAVDLYLSPILAENITTQAWVNGLGLACALAASSPFLWALAFSHISSPREDWENRRERYALLMLEATRWLLTITIVGMLSARFVEPETAFLLSASLAALSAFVFSRHLAKVYSFIEGRFLSNLSERETTAASKKARIPPLAPWDAHLASFKVVPESTLVGRTLEQAKIREHSGVTVALIERGDLKIPAPGRTAVLYPHDKVTVIGTDEQIDRFRSAIEAALPAAQGDGVSKYGLVSYVVENDSPYALKSIRDCGIREKSHGLVVGIERTGQRILNPDSAIVIEPGDLLWIVGNKDLMREL